MSPGASRHIDDSNAPPDSLIFSLKRANNNRWHGPFPDGRFIIPPLRGVSTSPSRNLSKILIQEDQGRRARLSASLPAPMRLPGRCDRVPPLPKSSTNRMFNRNRLVTISVHTTFYIGRHPTSDSTRVCSRLLAFQWTRVRDPPAG